MPEAIKTITDIVADLQARKEVRLVKVYAELRKTNEGIKAITGKTAREAYEHEISEPKLKTGTLIDDMLGGGLNVGSSMLLYGEFGSGKSEIAMTMAVLCPDVVVYVDTEGSFRWSRIKQICDERKVDFDKMFDKIVLYQPQNWIEQMMILENMLAPTEVGKIGLIIVDSLTKLFRGIEFAGRGELHNKQPMIREYPIDIISIAKAYGAAMIYTSQIYVKPVSNPFLPDWASECVVGGPSLQHQSTYVIHLRRSLGIARIARLVDADDQPLAERPFVITAAGIEDMPDTEKAADMIKKAEEYETKQRNMLFEEKKKRGKKAEITEPTQSPAEINEPIQSPAETSLLGEEENAS